MKKYFYYLSMAVFAVLIQSCSSDDESINLEEDYFTIENAVYHGGDMPSATITESLDDVEMSSQVMNGAMNYINIMTEQEIDKFLIGVKGVSGYLEYNPNRSATRTMMPLNTYTIPLMMSQSYRGDANVVLTAQLSNGDVMAPVEKPIFYIETMPGAIEIKLAFNNSKDIDLHLYTPTGEHIYFKNKGGTYMTEDGKEITYGLDIDSNANCDIDDINKENIYIPEELVTNGTYKVVVNMFENCNSSIATSYSVTARYKGKMIEPKTGSNPANGYYPVGAGKKDMTQVMTFTINDAASTRGVSPKIILDSFKPAPLSDAVLMKIENEGIE